MSTLVAGIGNIFLGDDGFGVEVAHRLAAAETPEHVDVVDYGIRGVHLAYDLLDGDYDTLVLLDAVPVAGEPGTVVVLDVGDAAGRPGTGTLDAHSMDPDAVLRILHGLGGHVERVLVVGCRPDALGERLGLSPTVAVAVDEAVRTTLDLLGAMPPPPAEPIPDAGTTTPTQLTHAR